MGPTRAHMGPNPDRAPTRIGFYTDLYKGVNGSGVDGPGWGPYGPMWAHMGPPGQVLEKASTFRQLSVRLLDQFRMFRIQN